MRNKDESALPPGVSDMMKLIGLMYEDRIEPAAIAEALDMLRPNGSIDQVLALAKLIETAKQRARQI